jgi:tetratricopeptide (TPR) repeat protein
MKEIKNDFLIEKENRILSNFVEPLLDRTAEQLKIDLPPSDPFRKTPKEEEVKSSYRSFLSSHLYNQRERQLIMLGFDVIIKNLHRVKGGEHVRQEILEIGNQLLKVSEEMLLQKGSLKNNLAHPAELPGKSLDSIAAGEAMGHFLDHLEKAQGKAGVSYEWISSVSEIGCKLFEEHRLEEAASVFQLLSILAPACHEAWFSLALCHHRLQQYAEAIASYSMAILTDGWDIQAFINLALCYKAVGDQENTLHTIHLAEGMVSRSAFSSTEKEAWNQALKELGG